MKHSFEKVGDHWEPKEAQGPSDPQAANPRAGRGADVDTAEGVDVTASKKHLYERVRDLGIPGRSTMTKEELVAALQRENRARTRQARQ